MGKSVSMRKLSEPLRDLKAFFDLDFIREICTWPRMWSNSC